MRPTEDEIEKVMWEACAAMNDGSRFPGMTYEEGVEAALRWVLGEEPSPLDD